MNKTDAIRRAMNEGQEYTALELANLSGVSVLRIRALLKHDIEKGRIMVNEEYPRTYRKATIQEQLSQSISSAAQLLKRHGYTVIPPEKE